MTDKEKMTEIRNLFYKMTLIGFVILFIGLIFCAAGPKFLAWWSSFLFGTGDIAVPLLILFGLLKTLVITLFLIPALALHWQCKCKK
ncbi:MAG: hypothetical protein FWF35_01720 [Elusimicrobia bacterium]|nr:hypothetical protein [Elusimicrobiota bacterium]